MREARENVRAQITIGFRFAVIDVNFTKPIKRRLRGVLIGSLRSFLISKTLLSSLLQT